MVTLTLSLAMISLAQIPSAQERPPSDGLRIAVSVEPITPSQKSYLYGTIEEAWQRAKDDRVKTYRFEEGLVFQFGDVLGIDRIRKYQLVMAEIKGMAQSGRRIFTARDFSIESSAFLTDWISRHALVFGSDKANVDYSQLEFGLEANQTVNIQLKDAKREVEIPNQTRAETPKPFVIPDPLENPPKAKEPLGNELLHIERGVPRRASGPILLQKFFEAKGVELKANRDDFLKMRREVGVILGANKASENAAFASLDATTKTFITEAVEANFSSMGFERVKDATDEMKASGKIVGVEARVVFSFIIQRSDGDVRHYNILFAP